MILIKTVATAMGIRSLVRQEIVLQAMAQCTTMRIATSLMLSSSVAIITQDAQAFSEMLCSALARAERAFAAVLLSIATTYHVVLKPNRDSEDKELLQAYRRLVKKAHPDKGGDEKTFQSLQAAREAWESARAKAAPRGRPQSSADELMLRVLSSGAGKQKHRVRGMSALLTYFGAWTLGLWHEFVAFVRSHMGPQSMSPWRATLEQSDAGMLHVHLALQFQNQVDRTSKYFTWKGRFPNASVHDYLGEGLARNPRFSQQTVGRDVFYVFADKEGTQRNEEGNVCVEGNCWVKVARATQ